MKTSKSLQFGISTAALLVAITATPAFAQTQATPPDATQVPGTNGQQSPSSVAIQGQKETNDANNDANDNAKGDVVVTGSLFRGNAETPSPVTTLTSANLEQRGINTVTEAIQRLSANGAGTLPNSFSANGAFASGASAPSLRGLTTDSTLVLFDGLRVAYYPLADDGVRNFVDINAIPDADRRSYRCAQGRRVLDLRRRRRRGRDQYRHQEADHRPAPQRVGGHRGRQGRRGRASRRRDLRLWRSRREPFQHLCFWRVPEG